MVRTKFRIDVTEGGTGVSTLTLHGILLGNGASDIQATAEPTNGQLLIGSTGNFPVLSTLTAGPGIAITNAAGSITVGAVGGGLTWTVEVADVTPAVVNHGYGCNKAGALAITLPAASAVGDVIAIKGMANSWNIVQGANQYIQVGAVTSTVGAGGSVSSTAHIVTGDGARCRHRLRCPAWTAGRFR